MTIEVKWLTQNTVAIAPHIPGYSSRSRPACGVLLSHQEQDRMQGGVLHLLTPSRPLHAVR